MTDPAHEPGERRELSAYLAEFGDRLEQAAPRSSGATPPRASRRRWRRPLVGVTGLAVTGLAAAFLIAPAVTPVDPVGEARAALGDPADLVHFVVRTNDGAGRGNDSPCTQRGPTEVWQATSGTPRWRVIQPGMSKRCGTVMSWDGTPTPGPIEMARDGDTQTTWYPQIRRLVVITQNNFAAGGDFPSWIFGGPEPGGTAAASGDPIERLRALLDQGTLREGHRGRLDGRAVVHLVGATKTMGGGSESRFDLAVDASSFTPVRFTTRFLTDFARLNPGVTPGGDGWTTSTTNFLTYEQRPMTSEAARELTVQPKTKPKTELRFTKAELERRVRAGSKR